MKAFEKWKKENTYSEIWGHEKHEGAELAWRAALEWAADDDNDLAERIRKELEDK